MPKIKPWYDKLLCLYIILIVRVMVMLWWSGAWCGAHRVCVTVKTVGEKLETLQLPALKMRRMLKGAQSKVLCTDWSPDKRHIVSSSQVNTIYIYIN